MACELCNGRHIIYRDMGYGTMIQPCPICGPKPTEEIEQEDLILQRRLEEAKARFAMEATNRDAKKRALKGKRTDIEHLQNQS